MDTFRELRTSLFKEVHFLSTPSFPNVTEGGCIVHEDYSENEEIPIYCPYYDGKEGALKHFHLHDVYNLFEKSGYEVIRFHMTQNYMMVFLRNEYERIYLFTQPCEIVLRIVLEDDEYGELDISLSTYGFSTLGFYKDWHGKIRHLNLEEINALFIEELKKEEFRTYVKRLVKESMEQMESERKLEAKSLYYM